MAFSPVPTQIESQPVVSQPSTFTTPTASEAWSSVIGTHWVFVLVDVECQTPPLAVPIHMSESFIGLTAIEVARPATLTRPVHPWPFVTGAGPMGNQLAPSIRADCTTPTFSVDWGAVEDPGRNEAGIDDAWVRARSSAPGGI